MKIEKLREALDTPDFLLAEATNEQLRVWAKRVGIPLEEPEPTLEERHPRPWKAPELVSPQVLVRDSRGDQVPWGDNQVKIFAVASYNREPLLLEIADVAERACVAWDMGAKPLAANRPLDGAMADLHTLLISLRVGRLGQREKKS